MYQEWNIKWYVSLMQHKIHIVIIWKQIAKLSTPCYWWMSSLTCSNSVTLYVDIEHFKWNMWLKKRRAANYGMLEADRTEELC